MLDKGQLPDKWIPGSDSDIGGIEVTSNSIKILKNTLISSWRNWDETEDGVTTHYQNNEIYASKNDYLISIPDLIANPTSSYWTSLSQKYEWRESNVSSRYVGRKAVFDGTISDLEVGRLYKISSIGAYEHNSSVVYGIYGSANFDSVLTLDGQSVQRNDTFTATKPSYNVHLEITMTEIKYSESSTRIVGTVYLDHFEHPTLGVLTVEAHNMNGDWAEVQPQYDFRSYYDSSNPNKTFAELKAMYDEYNVQDSHMWAYAIVAFDSNHQISNSYVYYPDELIYRNWVEVDGDWQEVNKSLAEMKAGDVLQTYSWTD